MRGRGNSFAKFSVDKFFIFSKAVKAFIKDTFGSTSTEYGQVSSIKFVKVVKK